MEPIKGEEAICAFSKQENTVGRQREMEFVGWRACVELIMSGLDAFNKGTWREAKLHS